MERSRVDHLETLPESQSSIKINKMSKTCQTAADVTQKKSVFLKPDQTQEGSKCRGFYYETGQSRKRQRSVFRYSIEVIQNCDPKTGRRSYYRLTGQSIESNWSSHKPGKWSVTLNGLDSGYKCSDKLEEKSKTLQQNQGTQRFEYQIKRSKQATGETN